MEAVKAHARIIAAGELWARGPMAFRDMERWPLGNDVRDMILCCCQKANMIQQQIFLEGQGEAPKEHKQYQISLPSEQDEFRNN